ncbi:hypothetical protein [Vibrio sp. 1180_3]|uniref:hypothetical protein n=1 Tax=Vibrio sp. 1180_3 TaxID=2528832 RepID=UPI0024072700|nr:hypothetical protein [Vibrio sp. 1180_3]MDF9399167.1 hypothetical protein [Vibrio sp. 1180_3]
MQEIINQLQAYWLEILIGTLSCVLAFRLSIALLSRIYFAVYPLPMNQFGFRGKLVYCDDSPMAKVFVSHKYELSAKPDFIYKIWWNKYAIVEYKSRVGKVKQSDINQFLASVVAVRSHYNIREGYIVTGQDVRHFELEKSTRSIYAQIAHLHKIARRIKHRGCKPKFSRNQNCNNCGYKGACHQD